MNSTEGTRGEDVYGVDSADSSNEDEFAPPRVRRSTYTPPPQYRALMPEPATPEAATPQPSSPEPAMPQPSSPEPSTPQSVVTQAPSHIVYSLDDGSLDTEAEPEAQPELEPEPEPAPAPPVWTPSAETPVWTAPAEQSAAPTTPTTDIPDWDAQQAPVYRVEENSDLPVDESIEPTSPYRPWTPDNHVDADAYWNTAQHPSAEPVNPIEYVPFAPPPREEAAAPPVEPLPPAPMWSLATEAPAEPDRYRPWVPEPAETTPLWEALFPTSPPVPYGTDPLVDRASASVPEWTPEPAQTLAPAQTPVPEQTPASGQTPEPEPAPAPAAPEPYMSPDDEAATLAAHAPPAGQPWIPQRRSLPDDLLLSVLEAADKKPGGTLDAMDALENEMRLREEEVQEYREWEDSMLAVGTPEALAVVAQVRPEFTAIVIPAELEPTPTTAIPIQYPSAPDAAPTPAQKPAQQQEPEPEQQKLEPVETPRAVAPESIETDESDVSHDMPQSWFDALAAHSDGTTVVEPVVQSIAESIAEPAVPPTPTPAPAPQPTGYPVPAFDDLVKQDLPTDTPEEALAPAPEEKKKRPFGVAVVDGQPQLAETSASAGARTARAPIFALEQSGAAPTDRALRAGRASRMFWLWFGANASVLSIGTGATLFALGMSLRQSVVAVVAGVALSFIPLGLGTLAGKRSGQPTVIVSRAAFGVAGNVVPSVLAFVSRVFWGSVLLWLFATSVSALISGNGASGASTDGLVVVVIVVGVMLAVLVAFLGYALLARVQLAVSALSALLIAGFVALSWQRIDLARALTVDDGPWVLVLTGAILVFAFLGLVWANSASDLARYQRPSGSGSSNLLWASFGTTLPSLLLISYGALLAASDPTLGSRITADPVGALTSILPSWYPVPLIVATALSLLSGVVLSSYSGAFALQGIGLRVERQWATVIVGGLLAVVAVGFTVFELGLTDVLRDLATTIAVPVAAWTGIFAADTMIRNRRLHAPSLVRAGGLYPLVNWVNLSALVLITALGWGLTSATIAGLGWQGYLFPLAGVDVTGLTAASDIGVLIALVLGLLTPLASGIPTIRRQEAAASRN